MLRALELIARQRIEAAIERGELSNLEGEGKPQNFDDERHIPEEHRMAYRMLKGAGFAPPGVHLRKRIAALEALLEERHRRDGVDATAKEALVAQISVLRAQLDNGR